MLEGILFCWVICMGNTNMKYFVKEGDKFGELTVLNDNTSSVVLVRCSCGKEYEVFVRNLCSNRMIKSCTACARAAQKGTRLSEETKARMSASRRGKHQSEETKALISAKIKGIIRSDETKARISAIKKGQMAGEKNPNWSGGRQEVKGGYISIFSPDHPMKSKRNAVLEHRLVMEEMLGRYLEPCEVVHHIDGNKANNKESNLMLFPSDSAHSLYHAALCSTENDGV